MGAAAYNRGSKAIAHRITQELPDHLQLLLVDLDAIERSGAPTPWGNVHFTQGHGGWWAEDPVKRSGFWYPTLRAALASWNVAIVGFRMEDGRPVFVAAPAV